MAAYAVTLQLPASLYDHFRRCADKAHRSLEVELLDAVAKAAPEVEELPPDLTEALSQMEALDDEALWRLARSHFPRESSEELEALHLKRQSEGLTAQERATTTRLVEECERAMVVRAQAARLLKERGHDVSCLLTRP